MNSHVKACLQYVVYVIVLPSLSLPCRTCRGRTALSSWSGVIFDVYKMSFDVELHFGNDWNSNFKDMKNNVNPGPENWTPVNWQEHLPPWAGRTSFILTVFVEGNNEGFVGLFYGKNKGGGVKVKCCVLSAFLLQQGEESEQEGCLSPSDHLRSEEEPSLICEKPRWDIQLRIA